MFDGYPSGTEAWNLQLQGTVSLEFGPRFAAFGRNLNSWDWMKSLELQNLEKPVRTGQRVIEGKKGGKVRKEEDEGSNEILGKPSRCYDREQRKAVQCQVWEQSYHPSPSEDEAVSPGSRAPQSVSSENCGKESVSGFSSSVPLFAVGCMTLTFGFMFSQHSLCVRCVHTHVSVQGPLFNKYSINWN